MTAPAETKKKNDENKLFLNSQTTPILIHRDIWSMTQKHIKSVNSHF